MYGRENDLLSHVRPAKTQSLYIQEEASESTFKKRWDAGKWPWLYVDKQTSIEKPLPNTLSECVFTCSMANMSYVIRNGLCHQTNYLRAYAVRATISPCVHKL